MDFFPKFKSNWIRFNFDYLKKIDTIFQVEKNGQNTISNWLVQNVKKGEKTQPNKTIQKTKTKWRERVERGDNLSNRLLVLIICNLHNGG